jgi:hypothetical protein
MDMEDMDLDLKPGQIRVRTIDDTVVYKLAPEEIRRACEIRFEGHGRFSTVYSRGRRAQKWTFTYAPENFWDGPTPIRYSKTNRRCLEFVRAYDTPMQIEVFDLNGQTVNTRPYERGTDGE